MSQASDEKKIFKAFAEVAPVKILIDSIQCRKPPEPDMLCQFEGEGCVGFELTELIDQEYMSRLGLMFLTRRYLNDYWRNKLSPEDSNLFRIKYEGSLLHFEYLENTTLKSRKAVGEKAFEKLLRLPADATGIVFESDSNLEPALKWIKIDRLGLVDPIIDVSSYGWLGNPIDVAIPKKFGKKYECAYPIELLAHINWDIMPLEEIWKASIDEIVQNLPHSPFRRIWVFDSTEKIIRYESGG